MSNITINNNFKMTDKFLYDFSPAIQETTGAFDAMKSPVMQGAEAMQAFADGFIKTCVVFMTITWEKQDVT